MADKVIYWSKTLLTGGTAPALDSIDGTDLQDGEVAHVWIANALYVYLLDVDSGAAEASPTVITPDTNAGNKRWILQGVRTINLGSDADGDMYYRASSVLARLAKGTADYKLFMNAAATAPEWAQGIGYIATSYDLSTDSGDQAISGVGFKPSGFIVLATINGSTEWSVGFGVGPSLIEYSINYRSDTGKMLIGASNLIRIYMSAGSQNAILKSWDSDGVTLTWTKGSSPTGTLTQYFIFFR